MLLVVKYSADHLTLLLVVLLGFDKTLAAQLARELRSFLKHNSVELFVSYYNHYLPGTYICTLSNSTTLACFGPCVCVCVT